MSTELYRDFGSLVIDRPLDGVLRLTMDRPEQSNSLDATGHSEMVDIWRVIDRDDDTRVVLLRANGRNFSAGGDFSLVEALTTSFDERANMWREAKDLVYNILNCSKPVVSAIQGSAVGAGLAAALLADITVAAKDAKLIDGHVRIGVPAGDHAAMIWPLLCGMAKAKYHLLLNEPLNGARAEEIGVVSLAVDEADLQDTVLSIATKLAEGSPIGIQWTKYALNNWLRMAGPIFDTSVALEMLAFSGPGPVEGLASFREKRKPNFSQKRRSKPHSD
jgi:enoyl-CoA hydratase